MLVCYPCLDIWWAFQTGHMPASATPPPACTTISFTIQINKNFISPFARIQSASFLYFVHTALNSAENDTDFFFFLTYFQNWTSSHHLCSHPDLDFSIWIITAPDWFLCVHLCSPAAVHRRSSCESNHTAYNCFGSGFLHLACFWDEALGRTQKFFFFFHWCVAFHCVAISPVVCWLFDGYLGCLWINLFWAFI